MASRALSSTQKSRIDALRKRHELLSARIENEQRYPSSPDLAIRQLKKQKLVLKEEIEGLKEHERVSAVTG